MTDLDNIIIATSLSDIYLMCLSQWVSIACTQNIYAYRTSGHQVKSLTVTFPSFILVYTISFLICSHLTLTLTHTQTYVHIRTHFLITSFEIKVSKSKSDLGHFFNNVGLHVCVHIHFTLSTILFFFPLILFIQLSTCREKWSNNEKSTRCEMNEGFELALVCAV